MKFGESFRQKSKEELEEQVNKTQEIMGSNILHPDASFKDPLDISTIQEKYKTRYDTYLASLRSERQGSLDTKEIKHAKEWVRALNNLDKYIKDHESHDNPLLREKQFVVFKKIRDFLEEGKREGYVKLPTGVGKTILFAKIQEALDMKTLIAAPSIPILNQNNKEVEMYTDSEFGLYYGDKKELDKKVTNITYHSLVNAVRDGIIDPDDIPVLILDEVHRSLGPERANAVNKFSGLKLGFSATTEFSENKKVSHLLEEEIFRMNIDEAIREGLACNTQVLLQNTRVDLSGVEVKNGKYDEEQLEKAINVFARNMSAVKLYKDKFSHLKAFVNCSGIAHANDVAELFNKQGVTAYAYTSETLDGEQEGQRDWILKNYKNGNIKVLVNAKALIEGFNEQSCAVTLNLHPTLSEVDAEQRTRSGRVEKGNPEKWSYVVDFQDQNSKKKQILYSEILGDARVWDITGEKSTSSQPEALQGEGEIRQPKPPINFDDFDVDGIKIISDTQTIMEVTNRNIEERNKIEFAPEGWLMLYALHKELKIGKGEIKKIAEPYRLTNPEWFKIYNLKNNISKKGEYYAPELIKIITENYISKKPPDDWLPVTYLTEKYGVLSYNTLRNEIRFYRSTNPEYFKLYKTSKKKESEHLSPKLISILENYLKSKDSYTYKTPDFLSKELNRPVHLIENFCEEYKKTNPEYFKVFKFNQTKEVGQYSPELVEIIRNHFKKQ
jgi:superfamily II DNA or RNA helicase